MRRAGWVGFAFLVLAAACTSGGSSGTTIVTTSGPSSSTTASTTTSSPTTTTTEPSSTTTTAQNPEIPALLVASPTGVYLVTAGDEASLVVPGRTSAAVADGRGGLLYQIDRDRDWLQSGDPRSTVVWWLPAGGTTPLDLLVPSTGQDLTLHDAVEVEGSLVVLYTRAEGDGPFELVDTLRSYDVGTRTVTQLFSMSAWESGYGGVSIGRDLISLTAFGQVDAACEFLDLSGGIVGLVGNPNRPGCESPECPRWCTLDDRDARIAYVDERSDSATNTLLGWTLRVVGADSGIEIATLDLDVGPEQWGIDSLDVVGDLVLVNRTTGEEMLPALVVAIDGTTARLLGEVAVAGAARFAPIAPTSSTSLSLRGDGLGLVALGRPVAPALALLEGVFGAPDSEYRYDPDDGDAMACFSATGYACDEYFYAATWDEGLSVSFADGPAEFKDDGVADLVSWGYDGDVLMTLEGIGVGSTIGELRTVYGDRLQTGLDGCIEEWSFSVGPEPWLHGWLSGSPEDAGTTVTSLWAGSLGSC